MSRDNNKAYTMDEATALVAKAVSADERAEINGRVHLNTLKEIDLIARRALQDVYNLQRMNRMYHLGLDDDREIIERVTKEALNHLKFLIPKD